MSPMGGSRTFIIPSGVLLLRGWICSLLADELLQFPLSDKGLNLLLYVVAISYVMTVVMVEAAIFVSRSLVGVSLQLSEECQSPLILDLP